MPDHARTSKMNNAIVTIVGATAGAAAIIPILAAVGFGPGGIVIGSLAALVQSFIGNVSAGSLFAFLQSASMGGGAAGVLQAIGAAIGAGIARLFGWHREESE
ncbi:hypothetical protein K449DRAFT_419984 [Hypoxylon sp. EC38]|nr:hypothetical protein K449DRAFT_419984 [Hypoxylon sp. EC38]